MDELNLTTPTLLFSAISDPAGLYQPVSFICPAGAYPERTIPSKSFRDHGAQIDNLRKRLYLTRSMQVLGISSLFFCVVAMFLIYIGLHDLSAYIFGLALLLLIASLGISIWEIHISVKALEIHLKDMENK